MAGADSAAPEDGRAGPYRLLHSIGEGGMGAVFLAERSDGSYEQQVAVKLIKRGMDSVAILRRFLSERRILARLAHPNIVRLLDGGMSADGRPYYVMEYVDGSTITEHAAAKHLSIRARVALVAQVAETVAYAHAQLVVHRDLKPSNILVDRARRAARARLRHRQADRGQRRADAHRHRNARALAGVCGARADSRRSDRHRDGRLRARPDAVRAAGRTTAATEKRRCRARNWTPGTVDEDVERASTLARKLTPERAAELHGARHCRRRSSSARSAATST